MSTAGSELLGASILVVDSVEGASIGGNQSSGFQTETEERNFTKEFIDEKHENSRKKLEHFKIKQVFI